jgi:hypothetical protein
MRWFGWFKKSKRTTPRAQRHAIDSLAAVYWDGSVNCSHVIKDISLTGALIDTDLSWEVGTRIRMSLQYLGKGGVETHGPQPVEVPHWEAGLNPELGRVEDVFLDVWSRVVRRTPQGLSVQFIFQSFKEAQKFRKFLESKVAEYVQEPHQLTPATSLQRTGAH